MVRLPEGFLPVALHIENEVRLVSALTEIAVRVKASKVAMAIVMLAVVVPLVWLSPLSTALLAVLLMVGVIVESLRMNASADNLKADLLLKLLLLQSVLGLMCLVFIRRTPDGFQVVLVIASAVFANDAFAQTVGRSLRERGYGVHRLAPRISPAKTVEGLVGGLLGGWAVGYFTLFVLSSTMSASYPGMWLVALCCPPLAVIGDLVESAAKRAVGVKDVGTMLGKHGGLMDRIDAITAAMIGSMLILYLSRLYM